MNRKRSFKNILQPNFIRKIPKTIQVLNSYINLNMYHFSNSFSLLYSKKLYFWKFKKK